MEHICFRSRIFQITIAPRVISHYEIITGRANTPHLRCKKTGLIFFTEESPFKWSSNMIDFNCVFQSIIEVFHPTKGDFIHIWSEIIEGTCMKTFPS